MIMESYGYERKVQQGEDWNLDLLLSASDREYIPFIISSERKNPYFVVTVASTKYEKNLRYVKSWWSSVDSQLKIPRFYQTTPQYIGELKRDNIVDLGEIDGIFKVTYTPISGDEVVLIGNDQYVINYRGQINFKTSLNGTSKTETSDSQYIYSYTLKDDEVDEYTDEKPVHYFAYDYYNKVAIYSMNFADVAKINIGYTPSNEPSNQTYGDIPTNRNLYYYTVETDKVDSTLMHKPYYYFYFDYIVEERTGYKRYYTHRVDGYECNYVQNFLSKDTAEWGGQNYMYQLTLVSGKTMYDTLNAIYFDKQNARFNLEDWPLDEEGNWESTEESGEEIIACRYKYVKTRWPKEFQPDIDATSPLGYIEIPEPILLPTKLEVFNNLRTLI